MPPKEPSRLSVARLPTEELRRELARRQRAAAALLRRRARVAATLQQLDREIAALGGAGSRRVRPLNDRPLAEVLRTVLEGKTLSISDIIEAVRGAGYVSNAANFGTIVRSALAKSSRIKRVGRGLYTAK